MDGLDAPPVPSLNPHPCRPTDSNRAVANFLPALPIRAALLDVAPTLGDTNMPFGVGSRRLQMIPSPDSLVDATGANRETNQGPCP